MPVSSFDSVAAVQLGLIEPAEADALQPLLTRCELLEIQRGEVVLAGNVDNDRAFILLAGALSVRLQPSDAPEIGVIRVGELVGEVSTLTGSRTSAWVLATADATLVALERPILLELANRSHRFANRLLQTVCSRLYSSNRTASSSDAESKQYRQKAFFDQLTGLKNRVWLNQNLGELLEHEQRRDTGLHFFMVDIDHFKRFNDTWGHAVGDQVLVAVAQALEATMRPGDHVVRVGGEEILVLASQLPGPEQALAVGERLRQAVEQRQVSVAQAEEPLQVTISVGGSRHRPGEPREATLERADQALYRAKEAGRNRVELS